MAKSQAEKDVEYRERQAKKGYTRMCGQFPRAYADRFKVFRDMCKLEWEREQGRA